MKGSLTHSWIPLGLIVVEREGAIQPGKSASQERLVDLRDRSKIWNRKVGENYLQDVKIKTLSCDHWYTSTRDKPVFATFSIRPAIPDVTDPEAGLA
jgi:hypothetical protein